MNVAFDPWIPVVTTTGERKLASLSSVFSDGETFADLAVRPHERVSLMRLFICVAHASLNGPKDYDEWLEAPKKLPESVLKYLKIWKDSFELFHKVKPWLQVPDISKTPESSSLQAGTENWTPVSKLNFAFATGNNSTLFDHAGLSATRDILLSDTVLSMLTFQCFSPGGLISQVYWKGAQTGKSSKDSPCVPASMMHAFLRGGNLLTTISLNLPTFEDVAMVYGERPIGQPLWECVPRSLSDEARVSNATETYLGRMVPMTRLIHLHQKGFCMLLGDGLIYPTFTDGFTPESTATVVTRTNRAITERALLAYRPSKAVWRELAAIVVKRKSDGTGGPLSLRAIYEEKDYDLIVCALARDKATILDTAESVFHIPSQLLSEEGNAAYESEVGVAESLAERLGWAVESYRKEMDAGWDGRLKSAGPDKGTLKARLQTIATTHYWTTVEKNLSLLLTHVQHIGGEHAIPTRNAWRKMLFVAALDAYRISCGQETPRQIRAFVKGWKKLAAPKGKTE